MARGINIPFISDVRDFLRGTSSVEDSLDDVAGALDNVGETASDSARTAERSLDGIGDTAQDSARTAERALDGVGDALGDVSDDARDVGRDMTRSLGDGAEEGQDAAQRLESSFRDALDTVRDESRTTGDDLGSSLGGGVDDASREVSEGTAQMRDDAVSNATEMAAGFDGSVGSMTDAAQGFIAEGLSGFGPAGAAAGLAAGIGIGLLTSGLEAAKEEAQEVAEGVSDLAGEMIDMRSSARGPEQVRDALKAAASEAEDGRNVLQGWADDADAAGINFGDYAAGMAGDSDAAQRALVDLNTKLGEQAAAAQALREEAAQAGADRSYQTRIGQDIAALEPYTTALREAKEALIDETGVVEESSAVYGLYTTAVGASSAAQLDATEAAEAATEAAEEQRDAADELVTATEAVTTAVRDAASAKIEASNAEVGYMAAVDGATKSIQDNGSTLDLATEAGRNNQSALNTLAAQTLSLADANRVNGAATNESNAKLVAGRDAFINAAIAAGQTEQSARDLADAYGLVPETVSTAAQVTGVQQAKDDLAEVSKERKVKITPYADAYQWQQAVDDAANGVRKPLIQFNARLGAAALGG